MLCKKNLIGVVFDVYGEWVVAICLQLCLYLYVHDLFILSVSVGTYVCTSMYFYTSATFRTL